jgi:hypothetical protein
MPPTKEALTLYLAPWQKRMIKDFMPASSFQKRSIKEISKIVIKIGVGHCPQSYKIPLKGMVRGDWVMYLTDEQMVNVRDFFGSKTPITSINVSPEFLKAGDIAFT